MKHLRPHAERLIGKPIIAHHKNGTVHHGILHAVDNRGLYIRPHRQTGHISFQQQDEANTQAELQVEPAFFAGLGFGIGAGIGLGLTFLPWAALGGFWGGGYYW